MSPIDWRIEDPDLRLGVLPSGVRIRLARVESGWRWRVWLVGTDFARTGSAHTLGRAQDEARAAAAEAP